MAAIDKTYINNWNDYKALVDWCKDKSFTLSNGDIIKPSYFIYNYTEENFNDRKEIPVWNTPIYLDIWLIRNCPLKFIQDRLKEQYGTGYSKEFIISHEYEDTYHKILNYTSQYDNYERNGSHKFSVKYTLNDKFKDDNLVWWVQIFELGWWYNEKHKTQYHDDEALPIHSNVCIFKGNLNKRKLARLIKKWNLPKGTIVNFSGEYKRYIMKNFNVTIK